MEVKEIIIICAGGIFVLLLIIYALSAYWRSLQIRNEKNMLDKAYTCGDIAKMEYDIAFYDVDMFEKKNVESTQQQMTIDDLADSKPSSENSDTAENAILTRVDDEGVEEITGTYNPEKE